MPTDISYIVQGYFIITVLTGDVTHHVKEEESEAFLKPTKAVPASELVSLREQYEASKAVTQSPEMAINHNRLKKSMLRLRDSAVASVRRLGLELNHSGCLHDLVEECERRSARGAHFRRSDSSIMRR